MLLNTTLTLTTFIELPSLNSSNFSFLANPEDLKEVFDLDILAGFDLTKLPDVEDYGDEVLGQIQATMEELYGDRMAACMPEDRIQSCLMGVSTKYFILLYYFFFF